MRPTKQTKQVLSKIKKMREKGWTLTRISTHLGRTESYCSKLCARHDPSLLPIRPGRLPGDQILRIATKISQAVVPEPEEIKIVYGRGPMAYVLIDQRGTVLYVGSSRNGFQRVFDAGTVGQHRNRLRAFRLAVKVHVYRAQNLRHLRLLEMKLIWDLKPKFNVHVQARRQHAIARR